MTPNEITTLIASNLKKETDLRFRRQLYERVKYWRGTILKQSIDRSPGDLKYFRQTVYMPMEKIRELDCVDEVGCFVARTVDKVPTPLRLNDSGVFSFVGSIDGLRPFSMADPGTVKYLNGKYSGRIVYYLYTNQRIVIPRYPDLPKIRIDDVFDNPEEAMIYESCDTTSPDCDWWNKDMPMSADITQRVIQSILSVDYGRPVTTDTHEIKPDGAKTE